MVASAFSDFGLDELETVEQGQLARERAAEDEIEASVVGYMRIA